MLVINPPPKIPRKGYFWWGIKVKIEANELSFVPFRWPSNQTNLVIHCFLNSFEKNSMDV